MKTNWKDEREKLRKLSKSEGVRYLWDYYRLWFLAIGGGLIFTLSVVLHLLTAVQGQWFFAVFANTEAAVGTDSTFWQGYAEQTGYDRRAANITFDTGYYFDLTAASSAGNVYYQKLTVLLETGEADAVTMGCDDLTALGATGRLMDLRDNRLSPIMERYGTRLVAAVPNDPENGTEPIPIGIDLGGTHFAAEAYGGDCVLGISANAQHIEALDAFLQYIFEEGTEYETVEQ